MWCEEWICQWAPSSFSAGLPGDGNGGGGHHNGELLQHGPSTRPQLPRLRSVLQPQRAQNRCCQSGEWKPECTWYHAKEQLNCCSSLCRCWSWVFSCWITLVTKTGWIWKGRSLQVDVDIFTSLSSSVSDLLIACLEQTCSFFQLNPPVLIIHIHALEVLGGAWLLQTENTGD